MTPESEQLLGLVESYMINWLSLLGISLGLAMDAFAVSIAAGLKIARVTPRHTFRVAFHFGLFQFMMPVIGWSVGQKLSIFIDKYDHWVALGLLTFVGCKMLWEAGVQHASKSSADPTRGLMLLTLSLATSIDALAVGFSMALLGVSIWLPSVVIGLITATLSAVGITFGGTLGGRWQRWAEIAGGVVLILIGLEIFISH
jgi:manganese efflux pump family protein